MAVGTTRPTLTKAWAAVSDQKSVTLTHDGGPDVEVAIGGSAPAESQAGTLLKWGDHPLYFQLAASEFVYARQQLSGGNLAQLTVHQSAYAG